MIKAILCDLDDTLLQTRAVKSEAIKFAGKLFYNLDITDEAIDKHWGKPWMEFMGEIFNHREDAELASQKYKSIVKNYTNRAYPGTLETLEFLSNNYKLGILSSAARSMIIYDLECAGIPVDLFFYTQSAEDTNIHKPNPQVFEPIVKILAKQEITKDEVLYVGDTLYDYEAATGAGLHFVGMADRSKNNGDFSSVGAVSISSIVELPALLKKFKQSGLTHSPVVSGSVVVC